MIFGIVQSAMESVWAFGVVPLMAGASDERCDDGGGGRGGVVCRAMLKAVSEKSSPKELSHTPCKAEDAESRPNDVGRGCVR